MSRVFADLLFNSPKRSPRFPPGYEGTENMFYFFYKINIFRLNKEKDDIRSTYIYFNFFHETVTSHNLETANHIAHAIFVLHSAIKTRLLTNQLLKHENINSVFPWKHYLHMFYFTLQRIADLTQLKF